LQKKSWTGYRLGSTSPDRIIRKEIRMKNRPSLRKHINDFCKGCIYDCAAAGTWLQQVTLCSVTSCKLYDVRPVTKRPIPETVLNYYFVPETERRFYRCSEPRERGSTEHGESDECTSEG
jgi:hypothetical protein